MLQHAVKDLDRPDLVILPAIITTYVCYKPSSDPNKYL